MKKVVVIGSFPVPDFADRDLTEEAFDLELEQNTEFREKFESFQTSCRELGKRLAQKGVTIFVGSNRKVDADTYVVEGANQVEGKHKVVVYTPHNWPYAPFIEQWSSLNNIDADYWRVPGPWQNSTAHIIRKADTVIVVGGRGSTLQAGMSAPALCKPVIALTAFEGAAVEIFNAFCGNYTESGMPRDQFMALQEPFTTADAVEKIVTAAERFTNKRPYAVNTRMEVRLVVLLLVIGLIVAWGAVLRSGASPPEMTETNGKRSNAERVDIDDPSAKPITPKQASPINTAQDMADSDLYAGRNGLTSPDADVGRAMPNANPGGEGEDKSLPAEPKGPQPSQVDAPAKQGETSDGNEGNGTDQKPDSSHTSQQRKFAQDIGDSTGPLIMILVISAMLGSSLRAGLRLLQDQVVTWSDITNELIVGLLLSFSLLILYLAAGVLYEGDVLESTASNFRRLGVTVSAFALGSAFLLENAASEVRRRFGQTLQR